MARACSVRAVPAGRERRQPKPVTSDSKYYALHEHLRNAPRQSALTLAFSDVERVLAGELPPGARSHRAWWGNSQSGHPQSRAWLLAGWRVTSVDVAAETVIFSPTEP